MMDRVEQRDDAPSISKFRIQSGSNYCIVTVESFSTSGADYQPGAITIAVDDDGIAIRNLKNALVLKRRWFGWSWQRDGLAGNTVEVLEGFGK